MRGYSTMRSWRVKRWDGTGRAALPARQLRRPSGGVLAAGGEREEEAESAVARGVQRLEIRAQNLSETS